MDVCSNFITNHWKPNNCRECRRPREDHPNTTPISNNEQNSSTSQISCRYGKDCYRENSEHLRKYSHPHETSSPIDDSSRNINCEQEESEEQEQIAPNHRKLVEKQFLESIADKENEIKNLKQQLEDLLKDADKIALHHQHLLNALAEEKNNRERRKIENQRILQIRRDTPIYWGNNVLDLPFRKILIPVNSPQFNVVEDILNNTIGKHGNKFGTIEDKDPTEFIVSSVTRIYNRDLWSRYCFNRVSMILLSR